MILAITLCVVGVSATIYPIPVINDFLRESLDIVLTKNIVYLCLAAAPFVLILGSFFKRI